MHDDPFGGVGYGSDSDTGTDPDNDAGAVFASDVADQMPASVRDAIAADQARMAEPAEPDEDDVDGHGLPTHRHDDPADEPTDADDGAPGDGELTDAIAPVGPEVAQDDGLTGGAEPDLDVTDDETDEEPGPVAAGKRRLRMIAAAAVVTAVVSLLTMFAPFYTAEVPDQTLRLRDGREVAVRGVSVTATAWDLTHQSAPATGTAVARDASAVKRPAAVAGLPKAHAMLLVMVLFSGVGYAMRLTLPTGFGVVAGTFAFKQLTAMRGLVEHSRAGGEYITAQWGISAFAMLLALLMSLLTSLTIQVFVVNLRERQAIRAQAEARGEEPPPTVFTAVAAVVARQATRFLELGRAAATADADGDGR